MQQQEETAQDIFQRNNHSNIFRIKVPSHNASKQNLDVMAHAFVLNKLHLLPLGQSQKLAQLYKLSLEFLINNDKQNFKNRPFMSQILSHVINWQINMGMFGTWPYTRACFYAMEQKSKQSQQISEMVVLRRGILQPNKQQFMNKSQNTNFKTQELRYLIKLGNKQEQISYQQIFQLPDDLLLLDTQECWNKLKDQFNNGSLQVGQLQGCLLQYDRSSVFRFLSKNISKSNLQQLINRLKLRSQIFTLIMKQQGINFGKAIRLLYAKISKL